MNQLAQMPTRDRLLQAAKRLFARKGYEGASVRTICEEADASSNAVTYHFGSKKALFTEIVESWTSEQFDLAERLLDGRPESPEEFRVRLALFLREALGAFHHEQEVVRILFRGDEILREVGNSAAQRLAAFSSLIARFVREGIKSGAVARDVDAEIVAGLLHDRLVNQAAFASVHQRFHGVSSRDASYRVRWVDANLRIILHGILSLSEESPST